MQTGTKLSFKGDPSRIQHSHNNYQIGSTHPKGYQNEAPNPNGYQNGSISPNGYQNGSVSPNGSISHNGYQNGSVSPNGYQNGSVSPNGYQNGSVSPNGYQNGSVSPKEYQNGISPNGYQNGSVSPKEYQNTSVNPNGYPKNGSKCSNVIPAPVPYKLASPQVVKHQRERIWAVFISSVIASLPALLVGCTLAFPSGALLDLSDLEPRVEFKFDTLLQDIFGALAPIGALFGGPLAGWIADHAGRKLALVLVSVPYLAGYLLIVCAPFVSIAWLFKTVLLVGRFLTGVGLGWSCLATPVYLAEISSNKLRGVFSSFTQLFLALGILLIYLLGSIEDFEYNSSALIMIAILAIFEVTIIFLYETPRWLSAHKSSVEAAKALRFLRGPRWEIDSELNSIETEIAQYPHLTAIQALRELKKKAVLAPLLIICTVMFFQQIGGLNASTAYSAIIFKEAQVENYRLTSAYAIGAIGVVFTLVASFIIDLIGRKTLLIVSGIGMLIGTITLGTFFYVTGAWFCPNNATTVSVLADPGESVCNANLAPLAIVSLVLFNAAFSIGWGPVPWVLLAELIPLRVRGIGSGIATFVNWGAAAIVTGFYLDYAAVVNPWFAWWTFSFFNAGAILFVAVFVFETKGKNLEEIHHRFNSRKQ